MDFNKGETVICSCEVKDSTGAYKDPVTSMTITIDHALNGIEVNDVAMVHDNTGKYHYDYVAPVISGLFWVKVKYRANDGGRITVLEDEFNVR